MNLNTFADYWRHAQSVAEVSLALKMSRKRVVGIASLARQRGYYLGELPLQYLISAQDVTRLNKLIHSIRKALKEQGIA